jgi:hypothetical protein
VGEDECGGSAVRGAAGVCLLMHRCFGCVVNAMSSSCSLGASCRAAELQCLTGEQG